MFSEIRRTARWLGAVAMVWLAVVLLAEPVRAQGGGTSDTWVQRGPAPPGTSSFSVVIAPLTPTTMYARSTPDLPLFKSTDGGRSWTALAPLPPGGRTVLVIDPQTPTTLYVGWVNVWDGRVFKTTDGGASWSSTGGAWGGIGQVNALVINPRVPATLYMGQGADPPDYGGVYKTTDGSVTWTAAKTGLPDRSWFPPATPGVNSLAIDPQAPDTVYAGAGSHGLYKSMDGGASWFVTGLTGGSVWGIIVDPSTPTTLYASRLTSVEGSSAYLLYRSIDAGMSWTPFQIGLPSAVTSFLVDPHDSSALYAATETGVFRSSDGGMNWTAINDGLTHPVTMLATDGLTPTTLYAVTSAGLFARTMTPRHTLSLQHMGDGTGVVTSSPQGIDCGTDCTELFREGTVVTLSAAAAAGSRFTSWSGCDAVEEDGDCSVTMDGVRNVIATFERQLVSLTVRTSGPRDGTVTSTPSGIDCGSDCSEWFAMGTVVTLTATPERGVVARWKGCDSDSGPGLTSTCTVTMTAGRSVITAFAPKLKKPKHEHDPQ
jgi:photosystem II stability/assembly factor-like uncharacterized protein